MSDTEPTGHNHKERQFARYAISQLPEDPSLDDRLKAVQSIMLFQGLNPGACVFFEDPSEPLGIGVTLKEDVLKTKEELATADAEAVKALQERGFDPLEIQDMSLKDKAEALVVSTDES
jgi:hypothetical protein